MQTTPCVPCCSTPLTTNIPGATGATGAAGVDGVNAYTTLTVGFVATGVASTSHTLTVADSSWMAIGQVLVIDGPVHVQVTAVPSATSVTVIELAYTGDTTGAIAAGTTVSPAGPQGELFDALSVYAVGAAAVALTATDIQLAFSVTKPDLTITAAGTYLLFGRAHYKYDGAEWASNATLTTKLKLVSPATDLISSHFVLPIIAHPGAVNDAFEVNLPPVLFKTANTTDVISLRAILSAVPDAHTFSIAEGSVVAVRLNSTTS